MSAAQALLWRALVEAAKSGTGTEDEDAGKWQQFIASLRPADRALFEDAQNWQTLCEKVRYCLEEAPNGYASIFGGDENLTASVLSQGRGHSFVQLTMSYSAPTDIREDLSAVVKYGSNYRGNA